MAAVRQQFALHVHQSDARLCCHRTLQAALLQQAVQERGVAEEGLMAELEATRQGGRRLGNGLGVPGCCRVGAMHLADEVHGRYMRCRLGGRRAPRQRSIRSSMPRH